jgi:eukaryotic-like serine/threonine-protein kinase
MAAKGARKREPGGTAPEAVTAPSEAPSATDRIDTLHPEPIARSVTLGDEEPPNRPLPPRRHPEARPSAPTTERIVSPDDYEILREYATGGLGRVLEAKDKRLDRIVALKELKREHPIARARFAREVQVTARLQHPNIVPIHEAGRWPNGSSFYSMKLVEGQTLARAIETAASLEGRFALLPAVVDVARAIAYAHGQRIIHRDLKPANVLVGPFAETVVIDWGLAKHLDQPDEPTADEDIDSGGVFSTRLGAIVGTPTFMPPEQAKGEPVDERADVYALGALLYNVIAGRCPYHDVPPGEVLDRVVDSPPIPLERHAPDTPPDLLAIVDKAMARDLDGRYRSGQELLDELERYAAGRLVDAYQYSTGDLLQRFIGRHRAAFVTAALALGLIVTFTALFVMEVTEQRDRAHRSALAEAQARSTAEQRVDELLVVKAHSLLDTDPTLAVAWLKRLGRPVDGAATVAARAEDRGVALRIHREHTDLVETLSASPDGRLIASGGFDKSIVLWDLHAGSFSTLNGHSERITDLAFTTDSTSLLSAAYDGTIRLHDVAGRTHRVVTHHDGPAKAIRLAPDGNSVASIASDGTVRVTTLSGETIQALHAPVDRELFLAYSADGSRLLSGSHDRTLRLWDLAAGDHRVLSAHRAPIIRAVLAPAGDLVVSASEDGSIIRWSPDQDRIEVIHQGDLAMHAVAISSDGRLIAASGQDGIVRLWRDGARDPVIVTTHAERVQRLRFSPDGLHLASAGWDKAVRVVDLAAGAVRVLVGHADIVSSIAFTRDGSALVSGSWDKTVRLWPIGGRPSERTLRGHRIGVRSVDVSSDGQWIASAGHDDTVRLWPMNGSEHRVLTGHTDHVYRVVFSPDGRLLASSSDDQTVRLWEVPSGAVQVLRGHRADVEELAFSPDGRFLASASEDHTVRLWSIADRTAVVLEHGGDVTALAFAPDGQYLTTGSRDRSVKVWSIPSGELVETRVEHPDEVWSVAYSPDGSRTASTSIDGTVIIRSTRGGEPQIRTGLSGARLVTFSSDGSRIAVAGVAPRGWVCPVGRGDCRELRGHRALIRDMVFTPGRDLLITASGDATVQIWDLSTHERRVLEGHAAPVFDLAAFSDGEHVVSAGGDAIVQIWPIRAPPPRDGLTPFLEGLTTETVSEPASSGSGG